MRSQFIGLRVDDTKPRIMLEGKHQIAVAETLPTRTSNLVNEGQFVFEHILLSQIKSIAVVAE